MPSDVTATGLTATERDVLGRIDEAALLRDLAELVAIPSVGGSPAEAAAQSWCADRMRVLGLAVDEWDVERVREHDARIAESGRTLLTAAAEHVPTGSLVAFSELVLSDGKPLATQEDTLVLKEHRGHKLGTLVKCAGLLSWRDVAPASARVITYNAEENRPMLDINEAIGFAPIAYVGAWKKVLDD